MNASDSDSPPAAYVLEEDIRPWEAIQHPPVDSRLASLIVCARECSALVALSDELFGAVAASFPTLIRWSSTGVPFTELAFNRLQARRIPVEMAVPPPGFKDAYVDLPSPDSILCVASYLVPPITHEHIGALSYYRDTALVLSPDATLSAEEVCTELRPHARALDGSALASICSRRPDWVIARAYAEDDLCAWQFYGPKRDIEQIVGALKELGLQEVRDIDELALFLQASRQPQQ